MDKRATVLVVDDDPEQCRILREALTHDGYAVREAADGSMALDILGRERISLIIMDVVMPGMGGRELLVNLRQQHRKVPVILISGFVAADDPTLHQHHSPAAVLAKPLDPREVVAAARALIG